jgi:hypothetical protein
MRAVSIIATLFLTMILLATETRAASFSHYFSDPAAAASCISDYQMENSCKAINDSECCTSSCLHGTGECCASGILLNSVQKLLALLIPPLTMQDLRDLQNGIDPESLPEPP